MEIGKVPGSCIIHEVYRGGGARAEAHSVSICI